MGLEKKELSSSIAWPPQRISLGAWVSPHWWIYVIASQTERFPKHQKKTSIKFVPNLYENKNYVMHYRDLKFYLKQGLVITNIHRVLAFEQKPWVKKYRDFNTNMRKQSSSEFGKDFYKVMNNSLFGKTQENLTNRVNVEVITKRNVALKRVCKPSFKRSQVVREDLVIVQNAISHLVLNKPIFFSLVPPKGWAARRSSLYFKICNIRFKI